MGIGTSIVLIAVGAILRFAVSLNSTFGSTTVNWPIIGDILMIVGVIGLAISLYWMTRSTARRETVSRERVVDRRRDGFDDDRTTVR